MGKNSATSKRRSIEEIGGEVKLRVPAEYLGWHNPYLTAEEKAAKRARHEELMKIPRYQWDDLDLLCDLDEIFSGRTSPEEAMKHISDYRTYLYQLTLSEGFDVDVTIQIGATSGTVYPLNMFTQEELNSKFKDLADLAVASYNKENKKTDYKVLKVIKVNKSPGTYHWYYLTFTAKDVSPNGRYRNPKTFQAIVICARSGNEEHEVELCRIKARNG